MEKKEDYQDIVKKNEALGDMADAFTYAANRALLRSGKRKIDDSGIRVPSPEEQRKAKERETDRVVRLLSDFRDVCTRDGLVVPKFNVVIDYFKIEFMFGFNPQDARVQRLFSLLKLDDPEHCHDECHGRDNFDACWLVAEQSFILYRPNGNAVKNGTEDYFILEMTGQGCMAFEARGGNWLDLIRWCNSQLHETKRIDLAGDDLSGICPLSEVKEKIRRHQYVSNFRARSAVKLGNEEFILEPSADDPFGTEADVKDYQKGYSCTWGKKNNIQLQIYDKKAERLAKGVRTVLESAVRYEMRFGTSRGDVVLLLLETAFLKGCVGTLYSCLLRWLIEFKEDGKEDRQHLYRERIWSRYAEILGTSDRIALPVRQADMEASVARARSWISNQWASTAKVLIGIDPMYFCAVIALALRREMKRHGIREDEYSMIATFLRYHPEFGKFDRDAIRGNIEEFISDYAPYSEEEEKGGAGKDIYHGAYDALKY